MSSRRVVLGVDFGSTTAKAVLADEAGAIVARASIPQAIRRAADGTAEQEPDGWWRDLGALVEATRTPEAELAGLAISGHLPTLALADQAGRPLAPAMLYADRRADAYIDRACELSGQRLTGDELLPKLLWLAERRPDLLRDARHLFNLYDFLAFRLSGERGLDHRTAMRSGLFDPVAMDWRHDLAARLGLDPDVLPPIRRAGEIVGRVLPGPATELSIPSGTPVLVGLGDTPAELIGMGVVHAGDAMVYYGTTTTLDVCTHDFGAYLADPTPIRDWAPYREVGYAVLGPAIRWAAAGLTHDDADLAALDSAAAALPPDEDAPLVIPAFDAHIGPPSAIVGLQPSHGRADLHRAMLESFAFVARAGVETSGLSVQGYVAAGGGARSGFWRQIVTDTLGAPQSWPRRSDAALGMAMLAARSVFGSDVLGADLTAWLGETEMTMPDPDRCRIQERRYLRWLGLREALAHG